MRARTRVATPWLRTTPPGIAGTPGWRATAKTTTKRISGEADGTGQRTRVVNIYGPLEAAFHIPEVLQATVLAIGISPRRTGSPISLKIQPSRTHDGYCYERGYEWGYERGYRRS